MSFLNSCIKQQKREDLEIKATFFEFKSKVVREIIWTGTIPSETDRLVESQRGRASYWHNDHDHLLPFVQVHKAIVYEQHICKKPKLFNSMQLEAFPILRSHSYFVRIKCGIFQETTLTRNSKLSCAHVHLRFQRVEASPFGEFL